MKPKEIATPVVLVFQSMRFKSGRDTIAGMYRFARRHNWQIQCFETVPSQRELNELLDVWQPLGCLVAFSLLPGRRSLSFGSTPVVYLGRAKGQLLHVEHDSAATSALAAEELRHGDPASWGFFGPPGKPLWGVLRGRHFASAVESFGAKVIPFVWAGLKPGTPAFHDAVTAYLRRLPRPIAMFIAADYLAGMVIDAAHRLELRIPQDIALVSVDNDEQICENLNPSLSSVAPDFEGGGWAMCELLERKLGDPGLVSATCTYGPLQLVRRSSSRPNDGSNRLNRALEFIRTRIGESFGVSDVAEHVGLHRRSLERMFRAETGESVLHAIRAAKLDVVKAILRNRRNTIGGIAARIGFSSEAHLKNFFRNETGLTMSAWRKRQANPNDRDNEK